MPKFIYVVRHHGYKDVEPGKGPLWSKVVAAFTREIDAIRCVLDYAERFGGVPEPVDSIVYEDDDGIKHVVNYTKVELYGADEKAEVGP